MAGASVGDGRVLIFGHTDYVLFSRADGSDDLDNLFINSVDWVGKSRNPEKRVLTNNLGTKTWLESRGYRNVVHRSQWVDALDSADIAVVNLGRHMTRSQIDAVFRFVARGGGLIAAEIGWVLIHYGNYELQQAPSNRLLRPVGLGWADGYLSFQDASNVSTSLGNALTSAKQLLPNPTAFTESDREEAMTAMTLALSILPSTDPTYGRIMEPALLASRNLMPSPTAPVTDYFEKYLLRIEAIYVSQVPLKSLNKHRTADAVFGSVPGDAPRITRVVHFPPVKAGRDTRGNRSSIWLSTGLYAAPGEIFSVSTEVAAGLRIKISGEWNDISHRPSYLRMPLGISREFIVDQPAIEAGSAYGGLIYVIVPPETDLEAFEIQFDNVVAAPSFVLGQHTNEEWIASIRNKPAPWAELAADNVIITLSSDKIRSLENAEELMLFWANGLAAQTELAGLDGIRTRPERMYSMVQTAWGYGYAGYPIGGSDWNFGDYDALSQGGGIIWGGFHELGHLHQSGFWTDSRTTEVTVNIFTMKAIETVAAPGLPSGSWRTQWSASGRISMFKSARSKGGFSDGDYAERLTMYTQLKSAFGWSAFRDVFQTYHDDRVFFPERLPANDQEEWDQWMTRFSRVVGYDLSPTVSGIPVICMIP